MRHPDGGDGEREGRKLLALRRAVQPEQRQFWGFWRNSDGSIGSRLLITAADGSQWIGTAWFVSPRTLATAAHCVYITGSGIPGRDGWVATFRELAEMARRTVS